MFTVGGFAGEFIHEQNFLRTMHCPPWKQWSGTWVGSLFWSHIDLHPGSYGPNNCCQRQALPACSSVHRILGRCYIVGWVFFFVWFATCIPLLDMFSIEVNCDNEVFSYLTVWYLTGSAKVNRVLAMVQKILI